MSTIVNEVIRTISSPFVFFKEKFKMYKKHQNVKQTISTLLEVFVHKINCSPVVFCSLIFVLLVEFCLKNGLEIVMITSFAILLACTLLTHHSQIYFYTLIFICENPFLFIKTCENHFLCVIISGNLFKPFSFKPF